MNTSQMLEFLVEEIHSVTVATIGADGHPQTRIIDMMLCDAQGVYFLTARGKSFFAQLTAQGFIALCGVCGKKSISLRGKIRNIGAEKRDEIFLKNPYMQDIYPDDTRDALDVFCLYEAQGEMFDISDPAHVVRETLSLGAAAPVQSGYFVGKECIGCKLCFSVCPQKCIDITSVPVSIDQNRCLHCGRCAEICPKQTIRRIG